MRLPNGKTIIIRLSTKRFKRKIISELIKRGVTPYGEDFFAKIDKNCDQMLIIHSGLMTFSTMCSLKDLDARDVEAYFPNEIFGIQMLRYIALTSDERAKVHRAELAAIKALTSCLSTDSDDSDDQKKGRHKDNRRV